VKTIYIGDFLQSSSRVLGLAVNLNRVDFVDV
jgi:hypothetical protein